MALSRLLSRLVCLHKSVSSHIWSHALCQWWERSTQRLPSASPQRLPSSGEWLLGMLLGHADRRMIAAGNFAIQACGVTLLAVGSTAVILASGCILFGLGIGSLLSLPPLIAQAEFPQSDVPRVVALVTAVNQAVFAFAPVIFGFLREVIGGYATPFLIAATIQSAAGAVVILGRVPRVHHPVCQGLTGVSNVALPGSGLL